MVDFNKPVQAAEPNYDDPLTALNLKLSTPLQCWPELSNDWTELALEVRNYIREHVDQQVIEESPVPALLNSVVGNIVLMRTAFIARQTAETDKQASNGSRLEAIYRTHGETKLAELQTQVEDAVSLTGSEMNEGTRALQGVLSKVRRMHEGVCRALDKLNE